jgi:hypothetical protein
MIGMRYHAVLIEDADYPARCQRPRSVDIDFFIALRKFERPRRGPTSSLGVRGNAVAVGSDKGRPCALRPSVNVQGSWFADAVPTKTDRNDREKRKPKPRNRLRRLFPMSRRPRDKNDRADTTPAARMHPSIFECTGRTQPMRSKWAMARVAKRRGAKLALARK